MKTLILLSLIITLTGCAALQGEIRSFEKHSVERVFEFIDDTTEDILELEIDTINSLIESKKKRIALEKQRDEALKAYLEIGEEDE